MAGLRSGEVTNAAVDGLNADTVLVAALGGAKTFTHVPESTPAPYIIALGCRERPWAEVFDQTGDDGARQIECWLQLVSSARGVKEIESLSSRAIAVLTTPATWSGVSGFSDAGFGEAEIPQPIEVNGNVWFSRTCMVQVYLNR